MRPILIFSLLVALVGCKSKTKVPSDVLSAEEMIPVLVDIHVYEATEGRIDLFQDTIPERFVAEYDNLLAKYQISGDVFANSYRFYAENEPKMLVDIYDTVLVRLDDVERDVPSQGLKTPSYPSPQKNVKRPNVELQPGVLEKQKNFQKTPDELKKEPSSESTDSTSKKTFGTSLETLKSNKTSTPNQ